MRLGGAWISVSLVSLVLAAIVVPLAGVALASAERPDVSVRGASAADPPRYLTLPIAPGTPSEVGELIQALPLVDGQPIGASPTFLDQYRQSASADPNAMARLIDRAIADLRVEQSAVDDTSTFIQALFLQSPAGSSGAGSDEFEDADLEGDTFTKLATTGMAAIGALRGNVVPLNNLAVAISATSLASEFADGPQSVSARPFASANHLREAAVMLLERGLDVFPVDRAMTINLAFLQSLRPEFDRDPGPLMKDLEGLVAATTGDPTARGLLASLLIRADLDRGLDEAIAVAEPLLGNSQTEAAGRLVRGDAYLAAADRRRYESPFLARSLVERAVDEYDLAITLSGDASAYAGRALALDLLGWPDAAAETQREAVKRRQGSLSWRLRLAELDGCLGRAEMRVDDARQSLVLAAKASLTTLPQTRFMLTNAPGSGYRSYSVGSDALVREITVEETGGGASLVTIDPFLRPDLCMIVGDTVSGAAESAVEEALLAALEVDDANAAKQAMDVWRQIATPQTDTDETPSEAFPETLYRVVEILGGARFDPENDPSEALVAVAYRLSADTQRRVCRELLQIVGADAFFADDLAECIAEAEFRDGDDQAAAQAIDPVVRLNDPENSTQGDRALRAGILSERAGQLGQARVRYEAAATHRDTTIIGLAKLGDLDLAEGDGPGALAHYSLATAAIRTQTLGDGEFFIEDALTPPLRQYVDNNRGIALLMTARSESGGRPDCVAHPDRCAEAARAFAAAMTSDPLNPIYHMNAAWVARLSGQSATATSELELALKNETPLVASAHNDLGVLAAQRGDLVGADKHFRAALANDAGYDLAMWNLGVLQSRSGGANLFAGQALLADAARRNSALRADEIAFLTDENVYRVEVVRPDRLAIARAPGSGAAAGAAVFGAIAAVGALARLIAGLGGPIETASTTIAREALAGGRRPRLRTGGRVRLTARRLRLSWRPWFVWLPSLAVLLFTTAWTAAWMAPDALGTAIFIGLLGAALALIVHASGHALVAKRLKASLHPARWDPGIALAVAGLPFHVPAGPFLAERMTSSDPRTAWWISFAGIVANVGAAAFASLLYLATPMPFLRVLIATQLAVAAFALIPSHPLDGDRLASRPILLALMSFAIAVASTAIAVGVL